MLKTSINHLFLTVVVPHNDIIFEISTATSVSTKSKLSCTSMPSIAASFKWLRILRAVSRLELCKSDATTQPRPKVSRKNKPLWSTTCTHPLSFPLRGYKCRELVDAYTQCFREKVFNFMACSYSGACLCTHRWHINDDNDDDQRWHRERALAWF